MSAENKQEDLWNAAINGRIEDVKKLLDDDTVDVNGKCGYTDWTALHYACDAGHRDIVELLLDHGADIDATTNNNATPLMCACYATHASTTKLLLERGSKVNTTNRYGSTALHKACMGRGSKRCVEWLLAKGADTTIKNWEGKTPLDVAQENKHPSAPSIVDLLMELDKRPERPIMDSKKLKQQITSTIGKQLGLCDAAMYGRIDDVKKYLNDVNVNWKCGDGWTALHCACELANGDIAELLLDHGADTEAVTKYNHTPLMLAICHDHAASNTKLLLDRGSKVHAVNIDGNTPLHIACLYCSKTCVKELLAHGADTTVRNKDGNTALDVACQENHPFVPSIVDLLTEHKKRPEQTLMDSVQDGKTSILSEVSSLCRSIQPRRQKKAQVAECVLTSSSEQKLSSKVETIIDRRCEELESKVDTIIDRRCEEMKQSFEALTSQLTLSNAEVVMCVSNLSTIVGHLSSKVSKIEGHLDSNEDGQCEELCDTSARNQQERITQSLQRTVCSDGTASNFNAVDAFDVEKKDTAEDFEII